MRTNLETTDSIKKASYPIITFLVIIAVWQFAVVQFDIPQYLLPAPTDIIEVFFTDYENLINHSIITIFKSISGFMLAVLIALLMVILTCFFPILVSFVDGLENVDKDYLNLFKTMNAGKLDTFIHLKSPMSIEKLFLISQQVLAWRLLWIEI